MFSFNTGHGRLRGLALIILALLTWAGVAVAQEPSAEEGDAGQGEEAAAPNLVAPTVASGIVNDPTPVESATLEEERKADLETMVRRARDFEEIIDGIVRHVYEMRREFIDDSYKNKIEAEEALELDSLKDAIAYFEEFLKKYPNDPPYTPDAMFRLAELYYDVSYINYLERLNEYGEAQDKGTAGEMDPPVKEFDRTIALFDDLVKRYPNYRNIDGAYYLLGYCLNDTGKEDEARLAWLNLVCANKFRYDAAGVAKEKGARPLEKSPSATLDTGVDAEVDLGFVDPFAKCEPITDNSRFFFESWWLIGNYHFDYDSSRYGVETAMSAYKKLVEDPSHRFYDKGLYKLAWSYFKADMYPEAIKSFSDVVDYADQKGAKGSGMRPEAIQYLAVCFFTDDWDVDQVPDSVTPITRLQDTALMPQDREWTREVYARLGDIYSENEKHEEAIEVWELFLQKWPLDVQAPFVQNKIADAYREMRRFDEELASRSKLDDFGKDSDWWNANEDHPEAQNEVSTMAQDALINAAVTHHQNAQALRAKGQATGDEEILGFALEEYNLAASAYKKYIEQNPDTPDAYDLNFQMADALFWSGNYQAAKTEYISVRDSNLDDRHREDAAHMVVLCLERIMENEVAGGRIEIREEPPELEGDPPAPQPIDMPPLLAELMTERENYLKYNPGAPQTSTFEYQSAQNYYRYGHWDEAKTRYQAIYEKYCKKDELSLQSWKVLLNIAVDQNNLDEKERLALMEQERQCKVEGAAAEGEDESIDLGSLLGDVAMQRAMEKFRTCTETKEAQVCTEAGDQLVAAVAKAPKHESADAALHNAALAYENASRFDTAMQLYGRIVDEYPDSKWVDKCLFKQASAAAKFFEYEQSLKLFKILADEKRFKESEYREDAIYNTAFWLTNLQSYKQAIPYWERYSAEVDDNQKSIEAAFAAADMQYRAGSWYNAVKAYEKFIKRYERNTEAGPQVVKASYRMSLAEEQRNKKRNQVKAWEKTVELYKRLVNDPGSMSAEYAAESHFLLIEEDMRKFEKFEIKGTQKQIENKREEGARKVKDFEERYRKIQDYRRPEWSLAAEFRIGYAYEVYAKAILATPMPSLEEMMKMAGMTKQEIRYIKQMPKEEREDLQFQIEDKIRAKLDETVAAMEEKAQGEYKIAIELARKGNISNDWTLLALERMNAYDPENYPRQHNGFVVDQTETVGVPPWAGEVQ